MSDAAEAAKKARMSAYQRWEMASFDPVPVDRSAADQAALEKHLRRVRDEAHAQGLASGHVGPVTTRVMRKAWKKAAATRGRKPRGWHRWPMPSRPRCKPPTP